MREIFDALEDQLLLFFRPREDQFKYLEMKNETIFVDCGQFTDKLHFRELYTFFDFHGLHPFCHWTEQGWYGEVTKVFDEQGTHDMVGYIDEQPSRKAAEEELFKQAAIYLNTNRQIIK